MLRIAPSGPLINKEEVSKRKQTKSRNGCSTCRIKRRKCDETKPACQQCCRRKIECGGYAKELRWKSVDKANDTRKSDKESSPTTSRPKAIPQNATSAESAGSNSIPEEDSNGVPHIPTISLYKPQISSKTRPSTNHIIPKVSHSLNQSRLSPPAPPGSSSSHNSAGSMLHGFGFDIFSSMPSYDDDLMFSPSQLMHLDDLDLDLSATAIDQTFPRQPSLSRTTSGNPIGQPRADHNSDNSHSGTIYQLARGFREDEIQQSTALRLLNTHAIEEDTLPDFGSPSLLSGFSADKDFLASVQQPQSTIVTPETIKQIFDDQICQKLSITEDQTSNPWKTIIWPLTHDCPALYHALAAMTCSYVSRTRREFYMLGTQHSRCSQLMLAADEDSGTIPMDRVLSIRLALAFAEAWDYQKLSTGMEHINKAETVVREAIMRHRKLELDFDEQSRLSFLANTWMYMSVLARFTCVNGVNLTDIQTMENCHLLDPTPSEEQVDPLMGCATTLFPMLGRLTDLIHRVGKRSETRNSPAIISAATDLRLTIKRWNPSIDVEKSPLSRSEVADLIQTAEAYRWAALVLLRQTVPEIPWSHSIWELAQKALVFLATIPATSSTMSVQTFPLLVAGCEAFEDEDRDFIRERWKLMTLCTNNSTVERCEKVTAEMWRRRDQYEVDVGFCRGSKGGFNVPERLGKSPEASASPHGSDFPDSLAFRKGVDPLTRAGNPKYLVRGDLHWRGVIAEWGWEVFLG